jgi:hypothetical protein
MTASVPFTAPLMPPLTGASTRIRFLGLKLSAICLAAPGPLVDKSITMLARFPAMIPSGPSVTALTMSGVGRLVSIMSALDATSAGDFARRAPRATSGLVASLCVS